MDPELATRAAARHLHDLYNHFGDWNLAMAAYNCGPGCVDHAIQRTGFADYRQLRRLNVLPKETANYVPAILAMTIISKNAKDYGLTMWIWSSRSSTIPSSCNHRRIWPWSPMPWIARWPN
jgi:membrane-bound lytic murein transglycosylase D